MPNLIRDLQHFVGLRVRRAQRGGSLKRMLASDDPMTRAIARAAEDVVTDGFSAEEREFFGKADAVRSELLSQSDRKVTLTDFGAGNPGAEYSAEEQARGVQVTRIVSQICQNGGLPPLWNRLLFKLIRRTERKNGLELGTSLGMSAAYQGRALAMNGPGGRLATLDGAAPLVEIAKENWAKLGVDNVTPRVGKFQDTLLEVLKERKPIDYAFIDGHHDEEATLNYYRDLLPYVADGAVLVFDDILWYEGMKRAWKRLIEQPNVSCAVDLKVLGVVVVSQKPSGPAPSYELELR